MSDYYFVIPFLILLLLGLLYAQKAHYEFIKEQKRIERSFEHEDVLKGFKEDLQDYKKRVDTLALKMGFK